MKSYFAILAAENEKSLLASSEDLLSEFKLAFENHKSCTWITKDFKITDLDADNAERLSNKTFQKIQSSLSRSSKLNQKIKPDEYKALSGVVLDYIYSQGSRAEMFANADKKDAKVELSHYSKYLNNLLDNLKLLENPAFIAFVTDVAANTSDLASRATSVLVESKGKRNFEVPSLEIQLPVLDRFLNLIISLHNPQEAT